MNLTCSPAETDALIARLIDRGAHPEQIARLTDRQIYDQYFHPRDDRGYVEVAHELPSASMPESASGDAPESVPATSSREEDFAALFGFGGMAGVSQEVLRAKWAERYSSKPWEGETP